MSIPPFSFRPPSRRKLLGWHKWIGIVVGAVLLGWVVSGVVMMMRNEEEPLARRPRLDVAPLVISPAEAAQAIAGDTASIRDVSLLPLFNGLAYYFHRYGALPVLVDASSGAIITITSEMALRLAQELEQPGPTTTGVERLERHTLGYSAGPLPVYRVTFSDPAGVVTYVEARSGQVRRTTRRARMAGIVAGAHSFIQLRIAPGGDRTRLTALWIASLVSLGTIISGYWLALPTWRKLDQPAGRLKGRDAHRR